MTKEKLIEQLNEDLVAVFTAIIQYVTYAAKATGPYQPQLSQFFLGAVPDEQMHAQYLTNKIVELGGTPVIDAAPIKQASTNEEMLSAVLESEQNAVRRYSQRAESANAYDDKAMVAQLEQMIREESIHVQETERVLSDCPL